MNRTNSGFLPSQQSTGSELVARALQFYLQTYQERGITEALNQVYAEEPSTLDPALAAAQSRALSKEDW